MVATIQSKGKQTILLLTIIIFTGFNMLAQDSNYSGNEENISLDQLIEKAQSIDLSENLCSLIHEDLKNTYYVINANKLESKYEKIRLLELTYTDDALVSIGNNKDMTQFFYLTNNTLNKTTDDIQRLFEDFAVQSKSEMESIDTEQMRLWLIQHDKYSKK